MSFNFYRLDHTSPSLLAMTIMTATAVGFFGESFFFCVSTAGVVDFFRRRDLFARRRVNIERAKLLSAIPAPGFTTARPYRKVASRLEATCKDIVTGCVLQSPSFAPWALFRIYRHSAL